MESIIIGLVMIVIAGWVCKTAVTMSPPYAMLAAAISGAASLSAFNHLFAHQPIEFLLWGIFALIQATAVARWLTAHAADFIKH